MNHKFLKLTQNLARKSKCRHQHGAIVVRGNSILGMGWNKSLPINFRYKSNNFFFEHTHAEVDAIVDSTYGDYGNFGDTVYVVRSKKNRFLNSKPCIDCQRFLKTIGIKRVIYSIDNQTSGILRL